MGKILVLGAGLVARPLIRYFLDKTDVRVTVASDVTDRAESIVAGHPQGRVVGFDAADQNALATLVQSNDLTVSLLPAPLHPKVAACCVAHEKNMVTTSYVSADMRALDDAARKAGILLLNEVGLDPGIDHMSAMKIIHEIKARGGTVRAFRSFCGGLPAPDDNDNPWGYKFSWSPRAVLTAGKNAARYRLDGKTVEVPGSELFSDCNHGMHVDGVGELEAYPNRDSLSYIDLYGLDGIETMLRGTFRYPGWCESMRKVGELGLLDETHVVYPPGTTFSQFTDSLVPPGDGGDLSCRVAARLGLDFHSDVIKRLEWLGLFSDERIGATEIETTPLDVLAARMGERMAYGDDSRDMIVLRHDFVARFPTGPDERITSTLIEFGHVGGDSAMARTVSLTAAVASIRVISGQTTCTGVQIPVLPEIYEPALRSLSEMGITFTEERTTVDRIE